jgi:Integrase core domain
MSRSCPTRRAPPRPPFWASDGVACLDGDYGRAGALRQRRLLPLHRPRRGLRGARHAPPLHSPIPPRTNGKAERFIQTLTNRWAYGAIYGSSAERTAALPGWLTHYNFSRRHGSLGHKAPRGSARRVGTLWVTTASRSETPARIRIRQADPQIPDDARVAVDLESQRDQASGASATVRSSILESR